MTNTQIIAKVNQMVPFRKRMTEEEYNLRLHHIRQIATPYGRQKPKRPTRNEVGDYYGMVVSEVLRSIRNGEEDYIYNEAQVIDVLRYEPKAKVLYLPESGIWEVTMAACYSKRRSVA